MKENNFLTFLLISSISSILLIILLCFLQISTYSLPKVIWQFWDKEEPPPIIRMIKENNMKKLTGWKFNYLNEKTIGQYISPFDYPTNYDELSPAHKADWIRVFLLKTYGGVWMDASIIINNPKAIDALYDQSIQQQSELTLFQFKTYLNIENWFIMAPKNSRMIEAWFNEYDSAIRMGFINYKKKLWKEGINTTCGRKEDPIEDVYFTQHYGMQRIIQKELVRDPNIIVNEAKETMLKIDYLCDGKNEEEKNKCLIGYYSDFDSLRRLPYIKLNGINRKLPINWTHYLETN